MFPKLGFVVFAYLIRFSKRFVVGIKGGLEFIGTVAMEFDFLIYVLRYYSGNTVPIFGPDVTCEEENFP